jgi:hypothetical protein
MATPTWAGRVVVVVGAGLVVEVVVDGGLVVGGDRVVGGDVALVLGGPVEAVVGCVSEVTGDVAAVVVLDVSGCFEVDLLELLCALGLCPPAVTGTL